MGRRYAWGVVVVMATLAGCSGKNRPFGVGAAGTGSEVSDVGDMAPDAAPQSGSAGGSSEAPPDPSLLVATEPTNGVPAGSLGAPCNASSECNAPGFCVDGVCCSSACTELCAACDVPGNVGTCSAAPSDAACGDLSCAGFDTECRTLDVSQLALNCEAFGACKVNADCAVSNEPASTPCLLGAGTCSGAGACLVAGKASLGETCAADADCAEGHCVAAGGVAAEGSAGEGGALICCDAACDSPCQACSAAGHCEATPTTDLRCEAVACPADDVCRDYSADVTASQCRSFGQCQTGRDCANVALRPDAECECDATTAACRLRPGAACTSPAECASGACTANAQGTNVCCTSQCTEGSFCSSDGSSCVTCEGDAITCEGNTQLRCDAGAIIREECRNGCTSGSGCNGLPPLGFLCDAGQCSAPNVCQPDVTGASRCCSRNCAAEGKVCAENGSCVCQEGQVAAGSACLLQNGDPCTSTQQCQAGATCTDGVCCQQACNGSCERCEPNTGLCVAIASGQTDNTCNNGRQCNGARGDCRLTLRQQCSGNGAECSTNNCEPTVGNATQICCSQSCTGNRPFCRSNGQGCVQCETNGDCGNGCNTQMGVCNDLLPVGTPCGASSQCASNALCLLDQSSQTRCCERNCAAEGLLCNGAGRCVAPAPATLATVTGGAPTAFPRTLVEQISGTTRLWTVQNTGGRVSAPLSININAEFPVSGNCLGLALQPGASCSVSVSFAPQQPGTRRATLTLSGGQGVGVSVGVEGQARLRDGAVCTSNGAGDCDSNRCTQWLVDFDGDGFGSTENVGGPPLLICGSASSANRPPPFNAFMGNLPCFGGGNREWPYVPARTVNDCCDHPCPQTTIDVVASSALAFPDATVGNSDAANCAPGVFTYDFNCDGTPTVVEPLGPSQSICDSMPNAISAAQCDARNGLVGPIACEVTRSRQFCGIRNGVCANLGPGTPVPTICL